MSNSRMEAVTWTSGDMERRLSGRRPGSASSRAPGMATWRHSCRRPGEWGDGGPTLPGRRTPRATWKNGERDCPFQVASGRSGARKDAGARLEGRHSWRPLSSVGCARSSAAGRLGAFLRSSPTGPGPAKSCVKRSGGFPAPTPTGGLKVPPPGGHVFLRRREIGPSVRFRAGGGVRKNTGGESRCGRPVFLECEVIRRRQG